jgi:hypothetical protein
VVKLCLSLTLDIIVAIFVFLLVQYSDHDVAWYWCAWRVPGVA